MVTQRQRDLEGLGVCSGLVLFAVMCAQRAGWLVTGLMQAAAALAHADQQPGPVYVDS